VRGSSAATVVAAHAKEAIWGMPAKYAKAPTHIPVSARASIIRLIKRLSRVNYPTLRRRVYSSRIDSHACGETVSPTQSIIHQFSRRAIRGSLRLRSKRDFSLRGYTRSSKSHLQTALPEAHHYSPIALILHFCNVRPQGHQSMDCERGMK
jgi:hypothetical protein